MNILTIDQARSGAWCAAEYETKKLIAHGVFTFPANKFTYAKTLVEICDIVHGLMSEHNIDAVFIEDIQLRKNVDSFKKLAQLQGSLISMFERNEYLYDYIPPSKWQSYCSARGRTSKEIKARIKEAQGSDKKQSKALSIQYVKEKFGIETENDNLADAISMADYVVNNITIQRGEKDNG